MTNATKLKMYILIPDDVPLGYAVNSAAHGSLACYLKYEADPLMQAWLKHSFKKVTVKVTREQFEAAKEHLPCVVMTESALDNRQVALVFPPRENWPTGFKFLPLYA